MTVLCRDCKHCQPAGGFLWTDYRFRYAKCDLYLRKADSNNHLTVGGAQETEPAMGYCDIFRSTGFPEWNYCGPEGRHFEPRGPSWWNRLRCRIANQYQRLRN